MQNCKGADCTEDKVTRTPVADTDTKETPLVPEGSGGLDDVQDVLPDTTVTALVAVRLLPKIST